MSPPTKLRKTEEDKTKPPDGFIRFEVENVSTLDEDGFDSSEIEVEGVPWKANVCREDWNGESYICVFLFCMRNQSTLWRIEVNHNHILVHSDHSKNIVTEESSAFQHNYVSWGGGLLKWSNLIENGFVEDDKITVEIRFWITNTRGIRTASSIDFTDPDDPCHDVALVIEGEKIYVSKQILAVHSPVLKAMFFGNFAERNKKEIELKDIDREEFLEMIRVLYPTSHKITDSNVNFILKLGDRFQIKTLFDLAEEYLISSINPTLAAKILISDKYTLIKLQDHCVKQLKTLKDVKQIKRAPEYDELSDATKVALLERMFRLVPE